MKAVFQEVHPVIPVRDIVRSLVYYVDKLGFTIVFVDNPNQPTYAGIKRDSIQLHLQWHHEENWKQMNACSLRFVVSDLDLLFEVYKDKGVFHEHTKLRKTDWNTEEFAFYDPDMNGLTFYKDL